MPKNARLQELNALAAPEARAELIKCCGSTAWASQMCALRPFATEAALFSAADRIWPSLSREDWLEAFSHHPRIGEKQLREKFTATRHWAEQEQRGAQDASESTLTALAAGNAEYERKFGYVYLICATGKSADEMLTILQRRLPHDAATEINIAAEEQAKITRIRLEKWLQS